MFQHFARPSHRLDSSRGGAGQGPGQAEHPSFCSKALTIPCIHLPLHPLLPLGSMLRLFKNKGFWRSFCLASFRACWDLPIRAVGAFEGNDRVLSLKTVLSPQTPRYSLGFSQTCSLPSLRTLEPQLVLCPHHTCPSLLCVTKSFSSVIRHGPGVPYLGSGHRLPASVHRVPLLPCIKDLLIHTWIRTDSIVGIYMSGVCRCLRSKRQPAWKSERLVGRWWGRWIGRPTDRHRNRYE